MCNPRGEYDIREETGCSAQPVQALVRSDESGDRCSRICTDLTGRDIRVGELVLHKRIEHENNTEVVVHAVKSFVRPVNVTGGLGGTHCTKRIEGVEFSPSLSISGNELYQPSICVYWSRISLLENGPVSECITHSIW
jgi:hypothetical protein